MKQENLNELRNIYLNIATGGEGPEFLSEAPKVTVVDPNFETRAIGNAARAATDKLKQLAISNPIYSIPSLLPKKTLAKAVVTPVKSDPVKPVVKSDPVKPVVKSDPVTPVVKSDSVTPVKSAPVTQRPAASGPVLSKLKGVEGTGVGANFKAKAFNDTERTRYSSVAAAKPAIPTGTTAGGTTFQRRAATGDELRAAQASRAAGGSEESAIKAGVGASKPVAPVGDKFGTTSTIKPPPPTQVKSDTPTTQLTKMQPSSSDNSGETDRLKKALDIKKSDVTSSYQWPSIKTIRDIADAYTSIYEKNNDGNLANNYPPYDKVTRGDVIAGATGNDEMGGKKKKTNKLKEATAMAKRGLDEPAIRNKIAAKTSASGAGKFADKATKLADRETYGNKEMKAGREKLARTQRGTFRDTTSSSPGLRGYGYKSSDPAVKAKQDARGNQRARAALTPNERKQLNMEFDLWVDGLLSEGYDLSNYTWNEVYEIYENATVLTEEEYEIYSLVLEHLLSNGYAETEHDANIIIENMSDKWVDVIIDEAYKGGPEFGMKYSKSKPLSGEKGDGSGYGPPEKFTKPDDKIEKPGTTVPPFKKGGYGRIMSNIPHGIGAHRDKIASKITTTTGGDPGAPTSQKMRTPDKKRLSREIVRKKPQA